MIVIGVVLLVVAAIGVAAAVSMGRTMDVNVDGWGFHLTTTVLGVFVAGAVAMLCLVLALAAFRRAMRRRRARRRELKQLRADEAAAASQRAAAGGTDSAAPVDTADAAAPTATVTPAASVASAEPETQTVDVREPEGAHAYRAELDDPGPERRYVPGDERVT